MDEPRYGNPSLTPDEEHFFADKGYTKCIVAYYSTKRDAVLVGVVAEAASSFLPQEIFFNLTIIEDEILVLSPKIQFHFLDNQLTCIADGAPRPMQGTYLRLMLPVPPMSETDFSAKKAYFIKTLEECASLISLFHGEFVAMERHLLYETNLDSGNTWFSEDQVKLRQTMADEHLDQDLAKIIDEERNLNLNYNSTAMSLIRRAHHERDDSAKFLFMWIALEAVLGSGKDRKRFAIETMGSEYLNDIINNLRLIRDNLLHDGELVDLTHKDYLQIKCVIIMGMTKNEKLRHRLLNYIMLALGK